MEISLERLLLKSAYVVVLIALVLGLAFIGVFLKPKDVKRYSVKLPL